MNLQSVLIYQAHNMFLAVLILRSFLCLVHSLQKS
jgi:hypothetical protein